MSPSLSSEELGSGDDSREESLTSVNGIADILKRLRGLEAWRQAHEDRVAYLEGCVFPLMEKSTSERWPAGISSPLPLTPLKVEHVWKALDSRLAHGGDDLESSRASSLKSPVPGGEVVDKLAVSSEHQTFRPKAKRRPLALNTSALSTGQRKELQKVEQSTNPVARPATPEPPCPTEQPVEPLTEPPTASTAGSEDIFLLTGANAGAEKADQLSWTKPHDDEDSGGCSAASSDPDMTAGLPTPSSVSQPLTPQRRVSPKAMDAAGLAVWPSTPLSTVQEGAAVAEACGEDEDEKEIDSSRSGSRGSSGTGARSGSGPPPTVYRPASGGSDIPVFTPEAPPVEWSAWKEMTKQRITPEAPKEAPCAPAETAGSIYPESAGSSALVAAMATGSSSIGAPPMLAPPTVPYELPIPPAPVGQADEAFSAEPTSPKTPLSPSTTGTASQASTLPSFAGLASALQPARGNLLSTLPPPAPPVGLPASCLGVASPMPAPTRQVVPSSQALGPGQVIAWYQGAFISGIEIRSQANVNAPRTGALIHRGEIFGVTEIVPSSDHRLYLKLADGRGWVFDDAQIVPNDPSVYRLPPAHCPTTAWNGQGRSAPPPHLPQTPPPVPQQQSATPSTGGSSPPVLNLAQALAVEQ